MGTVLSWVLHGSIAEVSAQCLCLLGAIWGALSPLIHSVCGASYGVQ